MWVKLSTTVDRIFELIKQNKMTAKQVAAETGISQSNFTEWKKGRSNPKPDAIKAIADFFKVSTAYLIEGITEPFNPGREMISSLTTSELKTVVLTDEAFEMLKNFEKLDERQKALILAFMKSVEKPDGSEVFISVDKPKE